MYINIMTKQLKQELGKLLLEVRDNPIREHNDCLRILEANKLVKYYGHDTDIPRIISTDNVIRDNLIAAHSYYSYRISSLGIDFICRYGTDKIKDGKFTLPNEVPWYDTTLARMIISIMSPIITAIVTVILLIIFLRYLHLVQP